MLEIIDTFKKGGVVLYPTDTQYGLGVIARDSVAVQKVREMKRSEADRTISIIVPDMEAVTRYVYVNDVARALMQRHLPGALTLILPAKDKALAKSRGNEYEIGIRIPNQADILQIVRELGEPITTTSANITGHKPGTTCQEILGMLDGIDLAIDGGTLDNEASTLIAWTESGFRLIRQGSVVVEF
jgi:tRNA threonylcarbamoyl adenosine modification protein (Sua5/YciO/YrdC/YwlC family)